MKSPLRVLWLASLCISLVPICGFTPDPSQSFTQDFIVTATPVYEPLAALHGSERFPRGAQLLLVHEGHTKPLVEGFAATADADVSVDGKSVLFSGRKAAGDPWQIYELTLADHSVRLVSTGTGDAIRPLYLPALRFVYAERTGRIFRLQTARINNSPRFQFLEAEETQPILPISFVNASAIPSDVLADGRVLFESDFPLGSGTTPEIYLTYTDGSGVEAYRCDHGVARWGGHQLTSGDVIFTHGSSLARFTSPLAHEEHVAAPRAEYAGSAAETESGSLLLSARTATQGRYAIQLWKPGSPAFETLLTDSHENLVEPVLVAPRVRPHHHPSALHPWNYANLLALDARLSREGDLKQLPASVRLETQDADGHPKILGTAPVAEDGSFFVKVPGDRPIRFALLDARGTVLRQEHGWFWSRGGEQRICVGCHTGPERAADNRVPAVLLHTTTPVDLTGSPQPTAIGGR